MTLMADYTAKREELAAKRVALKSLFDGANAETDPVKKDEALAAIKTANAELSALVDAIEPLQEAVTAERENRDALKALRNSGSRQIDPSDENEEVNASKSPADEVLNRGIKSIGEMLTSGLEKRGIKNYKDFRGDLGELALKTLIQTSGITPLEQRQPGIVLSPQEERTVADLMLQGTTDAQKITYYEETTFTNATATVAEGAVKPEIALGFTLREDNVRKIAGWVPVTDEMMEDVPGFESYLRGRLGFMVRRTEEAQLLTGDGVGTNILGLYNRTGVQTVTGYGMSTIDSILAAITEVQTDAFAEPTAFVVHPRDWFNIRTSKSVTGGDYLLGPATLDPSLARPWGLQVRVTTAAPENTGLVGDFTQAQVFRKAGITVKISDSHSDYFIYNKLAVLAEERLALAVYRPSAFCKVEAIVTGS